MVYIRERKRSLSFNLVCGWGGGGTIEVGLLTEKLDLQEKK